MASDLLATLRNFRELASEGRNLLNPDATCDFRL